MIRKLAPFVFLQLGDSFLLGAAPGPKPPTALFAKGESEAGARGPWEAGRAAKTAFFFGAFAPPNPFKALAKLAGGTPGAVALSPGSVIFDQIQGGGLGPKQQQLVWGSLDDVVMGGASESALEADGVWRGVVRVEGGGFAGIRTRLIDPPLDLSECRGLKLRVSGGDGRRFKFIVRDDTEWNGVAWTFSFDTKKNGQGTVVEVPFSKLVPTRFARVVPGLGSGPDRRSITALQFTYSKFEYDGGLNPNFEPGPFELKVQSVVAL